MNMFDDFEDFSNDEYCDFDSEGFMSDEELEALASEIINEEYA